MLRFARIWIQHNVDAVEVGRFVHEEQRYSALCYDNSIWGYITTLNTAKRKMFRSEFRRTLVRQPATEYI